jgi:hypothetical protein
VAMVANIAVVEEEMTEEEAPGEAQGEVAQNHRDCCCTSGLYFLRLEAHTTPGTGKQTAAGKL